MKQDFQDFQDCQDEQEKRLTCHNSCLFIRLLHLANREQDYRIGI